MDDITSAIRNSIDKMTERINGMIPEKITAYYDDSVITLRHERTINVHFATAIGTITQKFGIEVVNRDDKEFKPIIRLIKNDPFTVIELILAICEDLTEMQRLNHCQRNPERNSVDFNYIAIDYVNIDENGKLQICYIWRNVGETFWRGFHGYKHNLNKDNSEKRANRYYSKGNNPELYF